MSICSSTDDFTKDEAGKHHKFPFTAGVGTFKIEGLKPDRYGLKLFVDLNGNGVIDMNMLGIPKEPYAFSNNEMGTFGPPSIDEASFEVQLGHVSKQHIKLRGE